MSRSRRSVSESQEPGLDTRSRILAAARELAVEKGFDEFAMEKVAQRAGVSRMTIYYQFGSKQELLEALLDRLAERGRIDRLPEAMKREDPLEALAGLIEVFCGFWESDRVAIRRLRAWGGLKPGDAEPGVLERDAWRRRAVESVVRRIIKRYGRPAKKDAAGIIDVLQALTSFESYDTLARDGRDEHEVAALLDRTARAILGVKGD